MGRIARTRSPPRNPHRPMPQTLREINRARRAHQVFATFLTYYRRRGLRGAAALAKARRNTARIHRVPANTLFAGT